MEFASRPTMTAEFPMSLLRFSDSYSDLGCFNEEQCRFFLREVGRRVVPTYPFSFGMEEVYSMILEHYGYTGVPDVTSVLQELLESDSIAAGFGDDGDVWRSWRHSWRHRNDDALNPFIPRVGNFVLPPPTDSQIRKIRALNFIRKSEQRDKQRARLLEAEAAGKRNGFSPRTPIEKRCQESPTESPVKPKESTEETSYLLPATTYCHQRTRTLLASSHISPTTEDIESESGTKELDVTQTFSKGSPKQDLVGFDSPALDGSRDLFLTVPSEMGPSTPSPSNHAPALRGGQSEMMLLDEITPDGSPASKKQETPSDTWNLPRTVFTPKEIYRSETPGNQFDVDVTIRTEQAVTSPLRASNRDEKQGSQERDKSRERLRKLSDSIKPFTRRPVGDISEHGRRLRADNRQVQILNGVILNSKVRNRLSSPPTTTLAPAETTAIFSAPTTAIDDLTHVDEKKKSVVRRSLTPVWQSNSTSRHASRNLSRNSWVGTMKNWFRSERSASDGKNTNEV